MLHLTPDTLSDTPFLPEKNSDITRPAESVVDLDDSFEIPLGALTVMRIRTGHFTLNVCINTLRRGQRLVVTFQGARGGHHGSPNACRPMFGRRNFEALYDGPILAISDPQTELDWGTHLPRSGMYAGTFANDLVPEINRLVDRFCHLLGLPVERVLMYGSSSGGTAAMLVAARRETPTGVIAVVPFLRPDKYRAAIVEATARAAGGTLADWNRSLAEEPGRFNPLVAVRDSIARGNDLRVVVAQNLRDKVTIHRHFPGFWRRFDIDPEGGTSPDGRAMAVLFDSPEAGHGNEPAAFARPLLRLADEFFATPLAPTEQALKKQRMRAAKVLARAARERPAAADTDTDTTPDTDASAGAGAGPRAHRAAALAA